MASSWEVINVRDNGEANDVTQLISSISFGGEIRQASRKLDLTMAYTKDYYLPNYEVPKGSLLLLKHDNEEIMRTVVFNHVKNTSGQKQIISYDHLIYLLKSKDTLKFTNLRADEIIRQLCSKFAIPIGEIANTEYKLPKFLAREKSIYDMMIIALSETTKRTRKKYMLRMHEGKLNLIQKGKEKMIWRIAEGSNLTSASYSESIEEMKNRIVIVGDKDQVIAKVEDANLIKQYGILQEIKKEDNIKLGEAQTLAKNLLTELGKVSREAEISAIGIPDIKAGDAIQVEESLTGLKGYFWIDSDSHTIQNGVHTMNLKLNYTDEIEWKEMEKDE